MMCLPPTGREEFVKISPKIEEAFKKESLLRLVLVKHYIRKQVCFLVLYFLLFSSHPALSTLIEVHISFGRLVSQ